MNTTQHRGEPHVSDAQALQAEVLRLSPKDRARLLDGLIASLDVDTKQQRHAPQHQREDKIERRTPGGRLRRCHCEVRRRAFPDEDIDPSWREKDITDAAAFYEREGTALLAARFIAEFKRLSNLLVEQPISGSPRP